MNRPFPVAALLLGAIVLISPTSAMAHGPCRCTTPTVGPPGTTLQIDTQTLDVVWNPPPDQLRIEPAPEIRGYYVPGTATEQLANNPKPADSEQVSIPEVPPGRYLAVIYDGSEGGNHYTWDYVSVTRSSSEGGVDDSSFNLGPLAVVVLGGLGIVLAIWLRRRAS